MRLTQRFGPIPVTVTLDGFGNGTVTFQPNGSNARITTLFVKVSTTTAQASCTVYKGQVADGNAVNNTNSGSTGSTASGAIDLTDGETLYVRWTGGDAGATATATFTGITIPFDQVGPSQLVWSDPIAAGDGSLIYPAIKSPNYVAGVTGWQLSRNGDIEVNDAVVRGSLLVSGDQGAYIQIDKSLPDNSPFQKFMPPDTGAHSYIPAEVIASESSILGPNAVAFQITSPFELGNAASVVALFSNVQAASRPATGVDAYVSIGPGVVNNITSMMYMQGVMGSGSTVVGAAATSIVTAGTTFVFAKAFPVGVTPNVHVNMNNNAAATATWNARAVGVSNTGFDIRASGAAPGGTGFTLGFTYTALYPYS